MTRIAFATSGPFRSLTADDHLAVRELRARQVEVVPLVWDEASEDEILSCDAVVLRSCWDYHLKQAAFVRWLQRFSEIGIPLLNSAAVALANLDKRYLTDLAAKGAAIPKTLWLEPGAPADFSALMESHGLRDAVIKPAVSMGGEDTWRTSSRSKDENGAALNGLLKNRRVMVQEFIPQVLTEGEVSLVFLGGRFSHALRKTPKTGEFRIHEEHGGSRRPIEPAASWIAQAESLLRASADRLLYARVDGIPVEDRFVIMEVELIDPSLFLAYSPEAPKRFAEAIVEALSS